LIVPPPVPRRPYPTSERARAVVEWADVAYYVFWLVFSAALLVVAVLEGGPEVLHLLGSV
jgi:hypothetical protein